MLSIRRVVALIGIAALVAACGKTAAPVGADVPLSFAPADAPYAYANLEPMPADVLAAQSKHMHTFWPLIFEQYDTMLAQAPMEDRPRKIASAILDELRSRDSLDKLRELGFKPDGRVAVYGIGLIPVVRIELGDVAAFRAMIARIETKTGEKLPTGKVGAQDYWQVGDDKAKVIVAIENTQLVVTFWAPESSDAVKQTLLGIVKPAKNLLDAGTLQAIAKQYGFTPNGAGYFDAVALVQRLSNAPTGIDLEIAKSLKLPTEGAITDPVCKSEYLAIAQNFPRIVVGAENLSANHVKIAFQFEIAAPQAQQIAATLTAAPGTGAPGQGLIDFSLSLPILKFKDFWIKQADAIAAKPFACPALAEINNQFRESRAKIDVTIPPPVSDLTGMRFMISHLSPGATPAAVPDVGGKFFVGTTNPLVAIGMAQMALPQLKDVKLATDGKPVSLPPGLAPGAPPLTIVASDKAIAIATGKDDEATLGQFLAAPSAATPVFMRMHMSGAIYGLMARYGDMFKQMRPDKPGAPDQTKLFALYEKMLRSAEFTFEANASGIAIRETVDTNPGD